MSDNRPKKNSKQQVASSKPKPKKPHLLSTIYYLLKRALQTFLPKNKWLRRAFITLATVVVLALAGMYGIARWYIWSERNVPLTMGVTFIPSYAKYLGVDPQQTYTAILDDLKVRHIRLTSYWDTTEPRPGHYDFRQLDWQFKMAEQRGAKISLSIGLRQPRWPECHMPSWVANEPVETWQPQLATFIGTVVNRYKNSPSLDSYQLENEYFLSVFGTCTNFDRQRLINEFNLVKKLDPNHKVIIARSNNALGTPINQPIPDEFGVSVYKRVWDATITHRYVEYPFPAWFYAFLAGTEKIIWGKDTVIHELQAEPWAPRGKGVPQTSLDEQNKSLDAARFKHRIGYGKGTGMKTIDLWGAEYWYYRKTVLHEPDIWNIARQEFTTSSLNK